ncbi:MAG: B12-binding domain-containing radical SAM protein [Proteobacteria bacterium]|nr:B12-binding domain-containing radical SAM protein [Pseudomonadota bacterium]
MAETRRTILLLQPTVGEWDDMRTAPALPLALLHAATLAEQHFDVRIFDIRLHPRDWQAALARELTDDVFLVGASAFTGPMISSCLDMCRLVRARRPQLPIVWGGIHASLLPHETVRSPWADYVIQGEGERPLLALAQAIANDERPGDIGGLYFEEEGEVIGRSQDGFASLDDLPAPPWHIVGMQDYLPLYKGRKSVYFQSSRGCPLPCTYCYNVVFNARKWRSLSPEATLEQIRHLVAEHGVEDVYFVDDMFFTNLKRARVIAEGMKDIDASWQVQGVDILGMKRMTDEDYQLLLDSGCERLTCGIESGSPRMRTYVEKGGTVEDVIEVTSRLAKFPITLYYSFLCGLPTETRTELRETIDLMFHLLELNPNLHISPLYNFTPYPGTALFDVSVDLGLVPPTTLEGWSNYRHESTNLHPERRALYESLYFTSQFLDDKTREYDVPWPVRVGARAYRPVARFRTKHLFFRGLVEKRAMNVALAAWQGVGRNMLARKPLFT